MRRNFDVCVQQGHVARTRGATGTAGHRGSEQAFVKILGPLIADKLRAAGLTVALVGADDNLPTAEVFLALHQDGSSSGKAHGASVGYPIHGDGKTLADIWKAQYTVIGWPYGFRKDNYTVGLHYYYGFGGLRRTWWQRAKFSAAFLIEHGFATTVSEENWMWDHIDAVAGADAATIIQYLRKNTSGAPMPIRKLQSILNMFSNAGLRVDGIRGPKTAAAVRAYQVKLSIPSTGVWDSATQAAHDKFLRYLEAAPPPPPPPLVVPAAPVIAIAKIRPLIEQIEVLVTDLEDLLSEAE